MRRTLGIAVATVALTVAAPAGAATVNVQIEGASSQLGPVTVATPADFKKDGTHSCNGTSAAGALEAATSGQWSGSWYDAGPASDYSVQAILGESHAFGSGAYWSVYINNAYSNSGFCNAVVHDGDEVLAFASDDPFTPGNGGYDDPVVLRVPAAVRPGEPMTVTVEQSTTTFDAAGAGTTTFAAAQDATVTAGPASAQTGPDGRATLTIADRGPVTIVATKGSRAPDRAPRCVTDGTDGACGTTAAQGPTTPTAPCRTSGDDGFCGSPDKHAAFAQLTGIGEQQRFARGKGPRLLAGRVTAEPSGIADVRLRLTRNAPGPGNCSTFDGARERLVTMRRCGALRGKWFSVGSLDTFSYLLPARLGPGRYVLDVMVVDKAGNKDLQLARGRNRVVFHVA